MEGGAVSQIEETIEASQMGDLPIGDSKWREGGRA